MNKTVLMEGKSTSVVQREQNFSLVLQKFLTEGFLQEDPMTQCPFQNASSNLKGRYFP